MLRLMSGLICGGIFGMGLVFSGMTDTQKVQGFLDAFGHWDPTLAFVMGGAMLPMAAAWRIAARRRAAILGFALPPPPDTEIDRKLIIGSVLFGAGWAIAGFCPGPAIASISYGGWGGLVFLLAMALGMLIQPSLRARTFGAPAPRSKMDIRALTPDYAVSPQIEPQDLAVLKAAGFTTVIDNRPDAEIPGFLHGMAMKAEAEALGLTFVFNPISPGNFSDQVLSTQKAAIEGATGPVFAYCASGNRSSCVWALVSAGERPTEDLIGIPAKFGYNLEGLRPSIEAAARKA